MSGIAWLGNDDWLAVSDSGNDAAELTIPWTGDGSLDTGSISVNSTPMLVGAGRDFEGVDYATALGNNFVVSEEGSPAVRQFDLTSFSETGGSPYSTPTIFANTRSNRGFESLTIRSDGAELWTANEEALIGDGALATAGNGTPVRLQRYDLSGATPTAAEQFVYEVDPVHAPQTGSTTPQSGLSDLVVLPNGKLLALERSVIYNNILGFDVPFFDNRIYEIDFSSAAQITSPTDTLTAPGQSFVAVSKTLLWSGDFINLEGLDLGGPTDNGFVLLAVTDNQGISLLPTTLVSWEITGDILAVSVPEPTTFWLLGVGLLLMSYRLSRRR